MAGLRSLRVNELVQFQSGKHLTLFNHLKLNIMSKKKGLWSLLTIMMVAMLGVSFVSCSSADDDETSPKSSLVGTKWTVTYLSTKYIVEFTTATDVISYEADANNNYVNYMHEDKYTVSGNKVTFSNGSLFFMDLVGLSICYYYIFDTADINGNYMKLITHEKKLTINLKDYTTTEEEKGEKTFTLMKIQN